MGPLSRILLLWTPQFLWLAAGVILSLAALEAGVALMALSGYAIGAAVAGVLTLPLVLRVFGVSRVVLRYLERVTTHTATFRALADVRVWFFKALARTGAGGLAKAGTPSGNTVRLLVNATCVPSAEIARSRIGAFVARSVVLPLASSESWLSACVRVSPGCMSLT